MSSLRVPWQNGLYINQLTEQHKTRRTPKRNRHLEKKTIFCFSDFFYLFFYHFLNYFSTKCWVTALVRSMTFIGRLNQFKAIANLTLSQHFLEKKKKRICIYSLQPGHLDNEQNDRKVIKSKIKKERSEKRENSKYKRLLSVQIITSWHFLSS